MQDLLLRYNSNICINFYISSLAFALSGVVMIYFGGAILANERIHSGLPVFNEAVPSLYLFAGISSLITVMVGFIGFLKPHKRSRMFRMYQIGVAIVFILELSLAISIWSKSLKIAKNYNHIWRTTMDNFSRSTFQSIGKCCGFLHSSDFPSYITPECSGPKSESYMGCVGPLQKYVSKYLSKHYNASFMFIFIDIYALLVGIVLKFTLDVHERTLYNRSNKIFDTSRHKEILMTPLDQFKL
ncbi:hypothetical protein BB561_006011 [Smittium simulii]|uniref:Tetraspanin n=1 Tax=Smittium simulii TaxID=133385 RepID=A0A2T9Y740_9FUNG|nr:hypothetical protein BB561_006011 [Smittium simulii]